MTQPLRVLGLCGSLRKGSYNAAALRVAQGVLPAGMSLEIADISGIPLYNSDHDGDKMPAVVRAFKEKIGAADALLIATPEYNYSVPGVLKNAIDWASRPTDGKVPIMGKPLAIMGASMGMLGTARAQYHLRQICVFLDMHPVNRPEVFIAKAHEKFNDNGELTDEPTRQIIKDLLVSLAGWTIKLKG